MIIIDEAVSMMMDRFREEKGQNERLKENEELVAIFTNGVIAINVSEGNFRIKISKGEPYKFDHKLIF